MYLIQAAALLEGDIIMTRLGGRFCTVGLVTQSGSSIHVYPLHGRSQTPFTFPLTETVKIAGPGDWL